MSGILQAPTLSSAPALAATSLSHTIRAHRLHAGLPDEVPYGIGGAYLGGHNGRSAADDVAVYREAFTHGVRYFDSSSSRQYGKSEEHLGLFLREIPREQVFVATKLMPGSERGDLAAQLEVGLHAALRRLSTDYLDLYQLHDVLNFEHWVPAHSIEHLHQAIEKWKQAGLIRHFGIGVKSQPVLRAAMRSGLIESILTHNELLPIWPAAALLVAQAARQGVAVINGSPLGFGLLVGTNPALHTPHPSRISVHAIAIKFFAHCEEWNIPVVAAALQFPMAFSEVDIHLTGPGNLEQLRSSLRLFRHPIPLAFWQSWLAAIATHPEGPEPRKWRRAAEAILQSGEDKV